MNKQIEKCCVIKFIVIANEQSSLFQYNCPFPDDFWLNSGPLFFYTGNEGPIESFMNNSGFIFTLAKQFNALVVFAEHVSLCVSHDLE